MNEIVHLDVTDFDAFLAAATTPVIVDFWAAWCAPCRAVAPELEKLNTRYAGALRIAKVDIDAHPSLAERYEIRSIPTLLCFTPGALAPQRVIGAAAAEVYAARFGFPTVA
jgi:thioredoxin